MDTPGSQAMLEFTMSNYTLASLLYWMDQYHDFDYEISKESINNTVLEGYLRTECGAEDICAGTLFPGKFVSQKIFLEYCQIKVNEASYLLLLSIASILKCKLLAELTFLRFPCYHLLKPLIL